MRNRTCPRQHIGELLRRAALFRAVALGFSYPFPGHVARLREALAALGEDSGPTPSGMGINRALRAARREWNQTSETGLQAEYTRLFLGSAPCPPHQTAYGDGRRIAGRAAELADIAGFYRAFGLQTSAVDPDLPDHLCAEVEFYSLLLVKQAYATKKNWMGRRAVTEKALRAFLEHHLGRWVTAFADNLKAQDGAKPLRALARLLQALIEAECRRLKVQPRPLEGRLPFDELQSEAFTCPREGEAFQPA
jgi:TorA maturation chaperone TorD